MLERQAAARELKRVKSARSGVVKPVQIFDLT
jgi:hypothetical protein